MNTFYDFYSRNFNSNWPESPFWINDFINANYSQKESNSLYIKEKILADTHQLIGSDLLNLKSFFKSVINYIFLKDDMFYYFSKDQLFNIFRYLINNNEEEYVFALIKEGLEHLLSKNDRLYQAYSLDQDIYTEKIVKDDDSAEKAEVQFTNDWLDFHDGERTTIPGEGWGYFGFDDGHVEYESFEKEIIAEVIKKIANLIVPALENYKEWNTLQKWVYIDRINRNIDKYIYDEYGTDEMYIYSTIDSAEHGSLFTAQVLYESQMFTDQLHFDLQKVLPIKNIKTVESKGHYSYGYSPQYTLLNYSKEKDLVNFIFRKEDTKLKINKFYLYEVSDKSNIEQNLYLINYFLKRFYSIELSLNTLEEIIEGFEEASLKNKLSRVCFDFNEYYIIQSLDTNIEEFLEKNELPTKYLYTSLLEEEMYICYDGKDLFVSRIQPVEFLIFVKNELPF